MPSDDRSTDDRSTKGGSSSARLCVLGVIGKPHGVRGEVRIHRANPASTLILELSSLTLRAPSHGPSLGPDGTRVVKVLAARRAGDADVLRLEGCTSREQAEALRGLEVVVPRSALPALADGEVYHADLEGLRVIEDAKDLGEVIAVAAYPSVDALVVRTARGTIEIPILEPYVIRIDAGEGVIEVAHSDDFEPQECEGSR